MHLIGLMSGTSADGIDAALVEIEGAGQTTTIRLLNFACLPHSDAMRRAILALCDPQTATIPDLTALHFALGERFAEAAVQVAREAGVEMREIAAIASHGQTVWHQPEKMETGGVQVTGTLQIGAPAVIAARTGCRVVSDFRAADMAAGGQGAPLVPYFDWAVLRSNEESRAVLNIGGIANLTFLPKGAALDDVIAFDTGPGNMVIDALAAHYTGGQMTCDRDGAMAAKGKWIEELGAELLAAPYFFQPPPKSTGREVYGRRYTERLLQRAEQLGLSPEDVVATATALTARTISDAVERWLIPVRGLDRVIVGGGGARNPTLMKLLRESLGRVTLSTHEDFGIPSDAKEAMAFALLAYETLHNRPSNVPSATGASRAVVLGSITPPPGYGAPVG